MSDLEFRWFLDSSAPFVIAPYRRKFAVSCEGSLLYWGFPKKDCERWAEKMIGVRQEWAETKAAEAQAAADAKAARLARRQALADARAELAARQTAFEF